MSFLYTGTAAASAVATTARVAATPPEMAFQSGILMVVTAPWAGRASGA
jgi:hypothetical protein